MMSRSLDSELKAQGFSRTKIWGVLVSLPNKVSFMRNNYFINFKISLRLTLLKSASKTKFLWRERTYGTLFKTNVSSEVNLREIFPLPITPVVVELPMQIHAPLVDLTKS